MLRHAFLCFIRTLLQAGICPDFFPESFQCLTMNDETIITNTSQWISTVVIGHNLCPFAEKVKDSIHYSVCRDKKPTGRLKSLKALIKYLEHYRKTETAFLIFPQTLEDFRDYLDFVAAAENFLKKNGLANSFQLATFHNNYCFEGLLPSDAANYTNRSPYPMIHILRTKSVSKAVEWYGNTEKITERNIGYTREKGADFLKDLLTKFQ